MATRIPLYLDFPAGEVKEIASTDLIAINVSGLTGDYTGQAGKYIRVAPSADVLEFATLAGGGDLLSTNNLSDVASASTSRTNLGINTTANQTDSSNKRFMTDAQEANLDAQSGVNTGDQAITQTEIDFGTTPVSEGSFTITHTGVTSNTKIIASMAYDTPTDKDLDELDMDDLIIRCGNATTNQFTMFVRTADGSYLADKFKINYILYTTIP